SFREKLVHAGIGWRKLVFRTGWEGIEDEMNVTDLSGRQNEVGGQVTGLGGPQGVAYGGLLGSARGGWTPNDHLRPSALGSGGNLQGKDGFLFADADLKEILARREILPRRIERIGTRVLFPVYEALDFPSFRAESRDLDPLPRAADGV